MTNEDKVKLLSALGLSTHVISTAPENGSALDNNALWDVVRDLVKRLKCTDDMASQAYAAVVIRDDSTRINELGTRVAVLESIIKSKQKGRKIPGGWF